MKSFFLQQWAYKMLAVVFIFGMMIAPADAQSASGPEYYFKAAFLANFARLVEWPANILPRESGQVVLCVQDPRPFGKALEEINGKIVKGRTLIIKIWDAEQEICDCHILFANSPDPDKRRSVTDAVADKPVLVVGETEGFAKKEGMINFFTVKNKIRFEINQNRTEHAGLKISARLLKLALIVDNRHGK